MQDRVGSAKGNIADIFWNHSEVQVCSQAYVCLCACICPQQLDRRSTLSTAEKGWWRGEKRISCGWRGVCMCVTHLYLNLAAVMFVAKLTHSIVTD